MIIKKASFITSAASGKDKIVSDLPQVAVVGKSNVGKSSFINYSNIEYPLSDNSHLIFLYMFLKNRALLIQKEIIFPKKKFLFYQVVMIF